MRRIIYLGLILIIMFCTNGPCEAQCVGVGRSVSEPCSGPPWSGGECGDNYTCGERYAIGFLQGAWSDAAANLVIHSEGGIEFTFTWVSATGLNHPRAGDYVGQSQRYYPAGDYTIPILPLLSDLYGTPASAVRAGGLWVRWRACGESFVYLDHWGQRRDRPQSDGFNEREYLATDSICPVTPPIWDGDCVPLSHAVDGCYELPIPPGTEYIRSYFLSQSSTEWQVISVNGEVLYVPPIMEEDPQLLAYNFTTATSLVSICVGKESPWSGGMDMSDACIYSSFEMVNSERKTRVSIPVRPALIFD